MSARDSVSVRRMVPGRSATLVRRAAKSASLPATFWTLMTRAGAERAAMSAVGKPPLRTEAEAEKARRKAAMTARGFFRSA